MARRKVKTGGKEPLGTMSYQTSLKFSGTNLASSLYGVLLVPIGQFISVTYPGRTGGNGLTISHGPIDPKRFGRAE